MPDERPYQYTLIILFFLLAVIGVYHRIKAAQSAEKISRRKEGAFIMIVLRLFGFSMWLAIILYMINPQWMAWSSLPLDPQVRWIGAALGAIAIPLLYWMFASLGKNITDTVEIRKEHKMVTDGPYRYIRHPMYLFSLIYMCGMSMAAANWFILASGCITLMMLVFRTPIEEAELIEKFGDQYRNYMKSTGLFFPKF
jgi:protein-S-isoprenylcysteine O-methyltransferase Ste14